VVGLEVELQREYVVPDGGAGAVRLMVVVAVPLRVAVMVAVWLVETVPVVALKVALVAPAPTVTEVGTVRAEALSERATAVPPVGAALEIMTVHVLLALDARLVGLQDTEETAGAVRLTVVVAVPLRVVVMVAVWLVETVPVVALKVALVAPAPTMTEVGTLRAEQLSERATAVPPVGAALEILTVHVLLALDPILVGLQDTEETVGAVRLTVVVAVPLRVAVMVAVSLVETVPVVALKVALVAPAPTMTEVGTVRTGRSSERATAVPPVGAALEILTVHVLLALDPILVGLQDTEETVIVGAVRLTVVVAVPLRVAVMVTVWLVETVPVVALKVALVAPAPTVTEVGTVRAE